MSKLIAGLVGLIIGWTCCGTWYRLHPDVRFMPKPEREIVLAPYTVTHFPKEVRYVVMPPQSQCVIGAGTSGMVIANGCGQPQFGTTEVPQYCHCSGKRRR